jgi:hypothetical protein
VEEAAPFAGEAASAPGDAEVLAGEAAAEELDGPRNGMRSLIGFAASIGSVSSTSVGSS